MDNPRDIQRASHLSHFFSEHVVRTNPFGDNRSGERAYRRAERLVAALYLLTNHIPLSEPLRPSVRESGLELIETMLSLRDEMRASESAQLSHLRSLIRRLISLVHMLIVSGFASFQNGNTTVEALDELGNFLSASQRSPLSESILLSRGDFIDPQASPIGRTHARSIRDIKDRRYIKDSGSLKDKSASIMNTELRPLSGRKQGIIETLRSGGELGIRDISAHLPEYSEKMIQRELAELVHTGRVKKTGLKRWSRYSAVS